MPGRAEPPLGAGYTGTGSGMGRSSKKGFVASSAERFVGPFAGLVSW